MTVINNLVSEGITFAEFLESIPPGQTKRIRDLFVLTRRFLGEGTYWGITTPDIRLYCTSQTCEGTRFFSGKTSILTSDEGNQFLTYTCKNCNVFKKTFALMTTWEKDTFGTAKKLGEEPQFGPPIPSKVISLIGPDRELFLSGRRSEIQGLGIGAFAYYRRVVENQKNRIIGEIAKVAKRLGADQQTLESFNQAIKETQFSKAVDDVKNAIPSVLLIRGHNPLKLLHGALSEGLHDRSDEECLELAANIRVVLTGLADRISQALKDETELRDAVSKLLNPKSGQKSP